MLSHWLESFKGKRGLVKTAMADLRSCCSWKLSANSIPHRYMVNSSLKGDLSHVPTCLPQSTLRAAWNHFSKPVQSSCGPLFLRGNVEELVRGKNYTPPCCSFSQGCHWFSSSHFSIIHSIFIPISASLCYRLLTKSVEFSNYNSKCVYFSLQFSVLPHLFDALLLGTYTLRMVMSSWELIPLSFCNAPLYS